MQVMDLLTTRDLSALMETQESYCISIYLPTFVSGSEVGQNQIRYKNLFRIVSEKLNRTDLRPSQVKHLLSPLKKYVDETLFWRNQSQGLALFRSENEFFHYRLPLDFKELALVSGRFHIKPLLPMFSEDGLFYLLAFSKNKVRLLQGTKYSASEINIDGVPGSLAEALKYDFPQKELQYHTGASRHGGKRDAQYFGTGAGDPDEKNRLLRYFQQVDKGVCEFLKNKKSPLVIAGVEYLLPIYREASRYGQLVDEGIIGNPDNLPASELHDKAWKITSPIFEKSQKTAVQKFETLYSLGSLQAVTELEQIIPAANNKRIDTLFVATNEQRWGKYYKYSNQVEAHDQHDAGDEDLLDFAAVHTLINHGVVYPLSRDKMPDKKSVAAIFRY